MSKTKIFLIVLAIFLFAFVLRAVFLKDSVLTFGYDQAIDAITSQQILGGDIKIQGPSASTPGLYHGVFYYYLLAPAYFFGHGSPITAAYWIAFVNSLTLIVVFALGYLLSKKNFGVGLLSSFLFAISFESVQYATWLSNPTPAVLTVPLMYLGLWLWITSKNRLAPVVTALGLGLSIQSEIFLAYHIVPLVIWLFASRKIINRKQVGLFILTLILSVSTMILGEIKFGFRSIEGIRQLLIGSEQNLAYAKSVGDYLILYLNQIGRIFAFNSYPGNIGYAGTFVIVLAIYSIFKKEKWGLFLSTWLFSHLTVVTVGGTSTPFLMVGIGPAVSIVIAIYLVKWWKNKYKVIAALVLGLLVFGNLSMVFRENSRGSTLFAIQKDMLLSKQLALVDYTYRESRGEPFAVNSLTSPLWINIVWSYLYKWYGEPKYGYIPCFTGHDQVGQIDALPKCEGGIKNRFLILEPMGGIPEQYLPLTIGEENVFSKLIEERSFGELIVQKRAKL